MEAIDLSSSLTFSTVLSSVSRYGLSLSSIFLNLLRVLGRLEPMPVISMNTTPRTGNASRTNRITEQEAKERSSSKHRNSVIAMGASRMMLALKELLAEIRGIEAMNA